MKEINIPVGISDFKEIRKNGYYYVDKTFLIKELLKTTATKVTLITRPRRFGKTMAMSMLATYFDIRENSQDLFDGLEISKETDLCKEWMNQWPVIFLSLKDVDGLSYEEAENAFVQLIGREAARFSFLRESTKLSDVEKKQYDAFNVIKNGEYWMDKGFLVSSLKVLSQLLCRFYGQKTLILIDEYDVPLDKAFQHGYYPQMVSLIRGIFGQALKTNEFLQFAVLTGCLRISKESIFTGLNNFKVYAADDVRYEEAFGFTNEEVEKLLTDYRLQNHFGEVKEWYDGYRFGNADIYCPWDVINYVDDLSGNDKAQPKAYWINSSGNDLVKRLIEKADTTTRDEIEQLIMGNAVEKRIRLDLTYDEINQRIENMWSVLFTTGYLTQTGSETDGRYRLVIPNKEVREVFILQIREWFEQVIANDRASTEKINRGFLEGKTEDIQQELTMFLGKTISILDTRARNEEKEIFYHGILLGILKNNSGWAVKSNRESGNGFADILIKPKNPDTGIILELKYARSINDLDQACERALNQIKDRGYDQELREDGRNDILTYGIAFWKKRCKVVVKKI